MIDLSNFCCPYIPRNEIREIADNIREELWGDSLPIEVELIIERLNLDIIPMALPSSIDALLSCNLKGIVVNIQRYIEPVWEKRLRFSFAHELGHYILHKEIIKNMDFRSYDEYLYFINNLPEVEYRRFEYQANEFGGRLLVPDNKLKGEVKSAIVILEQKGVTHLIRNDPDNILVSICPTLCKPFYVSQDCIERRVKNEGLWPPKKYQ